MAIKQESEFEPLEFDPKKIKDFSAFLESLKKHFGEIK